MTDEKKPRTRKAITAGAAFDRIMKLRNERHSAADEAVKRTFERYAAREAEYVAGLEQSVKVRALAMADAEYEAGPGTAAAADRDFDKTFGSVPELLDTPIPPLVEPTAEDDPPSVSDAPTPEPTPRGLTPYTPGPVAQRARAR